MWGRTSSVPRDNARLIERRRQRRRRSRFALLVLLALLLAGAVYGLRQDTVRISRVTVYGGESRLEQYAREAMKGSYFGVIPRDSIFFFPARSIRAAILADYPNIAAVSIFRNGLTGISIRPSERVAVARWCPVRNQISNGVNLSETEKSCYVFDANGFIFTVAATSTTTINPFTLHAPLEGNILEPLRATIAHADRIPTIFDFARQLSARGSPVASIVIRGDEVDAHLINDTRITHVLGKEQEAFAALLSADEQFDLSDGSVEYVDLRFPGKVYVKRKE